MATTSDAQSWQETFKFPVPLRPAQDGGSRASIWFARLRHALGRIANRVHLPGAIADADISDPMTGREISVRVGTRYTQITVDGRDYYFKRLSGRYGGSGTGCR